MTTRIYAKGPAVPLEFKNNCNVELEDNEMVLHDNLVNVNTVRRGEVLLDVDFGSRLNQEVFGMNDIVMYMAIDTHIRASTSDFEPRIEVRNVQAQRNQDNDEQVDTIVEWVAKPSNIQSQTIINYPK